MKNLFFTILLSLLCVTAFGQTYSDIIKVSKMKSLTDISNYMMSKGYKYDGKADAEEDKCSYSLIFTNNCDLDMKTGITSYTPGKIWSYYFVDFKKDGNIFAINFVTPSYSDWKNIMNAAKKNGFSFQNDNAVEDAIYFYYWRSAECLQFVQRSDEYHVTYCNTED